MPEPIRTHLDRIKEQFTLKEVLEMNDMDEEEVVVILYDFGYLLYPQDGMLDVEDPEFRSGYNG